MAFAVICKSCQARFLLNDDLLRRKVAGRVVTVRCRQCHAPIEVDASNVDVEPEKPEPPKAPPPKPDAAFATRTAKPAPAPPRPAGKSSTLMGIGGPPRPAGATELVALSPGLLNVAPQPAPAAANVPEFPEPPPAPPPRAPTSDEWEIPSSIPPKPGAAGTTPVQPLALTPKAPAAAKAPLPPKPLATPKAPPARAPATTLRLETSAANEAVPESLDDFAEELPPSLPPPEEEMPSSTGTPSLQALVHHDEPRAKPRSDDFLANMSAAMNGGVMVEPTGAPTIDVSSFAVEAQGAPPAADFEVPIDVSAPPAAPSPLDRPLAGKQTLPLFAMTGDADPGLLAAPSLEAALRPAAQRPARPDPASDGSLKPATVERVPGGDAVRERRNVVAPATKSVPPAAPAQRRTSGLAIPVLLSLAAAAGFLIWKRGAGPDTPAAAERSSTTAPPVAPVLATERSGTTDAPATTTLPAVAPTPAAPEDDVTFETAPSSPVADARREPTTAPASRPASADTKPAEPKTTEPKPTEAKPTEAKPEPVAPEPTAKAPPSEPNPPPPSGEPAGPFNRDAAAAALSAAAAAASSCRKEGDPSGVASVIITFAPSGRVTSANIGGPPFAGTPTGGCIASTLRKARVPAFDGERVTVSKTIVIQ